MSASEENLNIKKPLARSTMLTSPFMFHTQIIVFFEAAMFIDLSVRKVVLSVVGIFSPLEQGASDGNWRWGSEEKTLENKQWSILRAWDVPWDWKVALYVMFPYLMRLKTVIKLSILYAFVSPYQPFPEDVFSYKWDQPFNLRNGWILWGSGGLLVASSSVLLFKTFISTSSSSQMQNEAESLVRLLPLVGASNISTASLIGILVFLAPLCEETLYRGFLMTSLTKWLPVHVSVIISAAVFTLAHQSPGKSVEIFIFGLVLGLVYAQTRNLLAPIIMHACWNLGVIFILMYFHSQGYDIQKYIL
ncbi:hypothetical protein HHK36_028310 [Tetracentron sinense]|uniref:CAAX prenyl protease 2/Lysostaphin resistance protein A-like domain-containing protein n=1 Tax=Tetracentron sinense TaxID=13715 RepID=A0A835D4C4_TETSI|nr:hypothetical protein HHK36_028310 [Tetracentron sinense]